MTRRILFVCHRFPYPPDKGDRIRSFHLLDHLRGLGRVDLACLADEPVRSEHVEVLRGMCDRVAIRRIDGWRRWVRGAWSLTTGKSASEGLFWSPSLSKEITGWARERTYDAVIAFSSAVLQYVWPLRTDERLIADLVDVDSQKFLDYAGRTWPPLSWLMRLEARRVRAIERRAARAAAVTLVSEPETALYRSFCRSERALAIMNGVDLEYFAPGEAGVVADPFSCVFVGYLDYRANVTGLRWFCEQVWPRLRARFPGAVFRIVGRNPVPAVSALGAVDGVEVIGPVPDVRRELWRASVVAVPLLVARGVQNKILEAMAVAKPVVATRVAIEGLGVTENRELYAADEPDEWVERLTNLWSDAARQSQIGSAARKYVEDHHSWTACLAPFTQLVEHAALQNPMPDLPDDTPLSCTPQSG